MLKTSQNAKKNPENGPKLKNKIKTTHKAKPTGQHTAQASPFQLKPTSNQIGSKAEPKSNKVRP